MSRALTEAQVFFRVGIVRYECRQTIPRAGLSVLGIIIFSPFLFEVSSHATDLREKGAKNSKRLGSGHSP